MKSEIKKVFEIWEADMNRGITGQSNTKINFENLSDTVTNTGLFYFYVIDFSDMSLSEVSPSISNILGFDPTIVTFDDIFNAFHPDDLDYIRKAEKFRADFFYDNIPPEKLLKYKASFNFRIRLYDGSYSLFNHQALMLTLGPDGGYGKCINIHTLIGHFTEVNNYRFSLIGIDDEPSYIGMNVDLPTGYKNRFSKKELEILKHIAEGFNTEAIAQKLFISPMTVKKHRANILKKSDCKNMTELIKNSVLQGLI